jgi:hypothetical protein
MGDDRRYSEADVKRLAGVLVEQLTSTLKGVRESVEAIQKQTANIPSMEESLERLVTNMNAVKAAIRETNLDMKALDSAVHIDIHPQVDDHEARLAELETSFSHA